MTVFIPSQGLGLSTSRPYEIRVPKSWLNFHFSNPVVSVTLQFRFPYLNLLGLLPRGYWFPTINPSVHPSLTLVLLEPCLLGKFTLPPRQERLVTTSTTVRHLEGRGICLSYSYSNSLHDIRVSLSTCVRPSSKRKLNKTNVDNWVPPVTIGHLYGLWFTFKGVYWSLFCRSRGYRITIIIILI